MPPCTPPTSSSSSRRSVSVMNLMYWVVSVVSSLNCVRRSTYCGDRGSAGGRGARPRPTTTLAEMGLDPHVHPFSEQPHPRSCRTPWARGRENPWGRETLSGAGRLLLGHGDPSWGRETPPHLLDDAVRCRLHFGLLGRRCHRLHLCLEAHQLQLVVLTRREGSKLCYEPRAPLQDTVLGSHPLQDTVLPPQPHTQPSPPAVGTP